MSTVEEELRSLHWAHKFFRDLMDSKLFPGISLKIKNMAWDRAYNLEGVSREDLSYEATQHYLQLCRELLGLLQNKSLSRVPPHVRDIAWRISRHFPLAMRAELVGWRDTPRPEPLYEGGTIWA